jgi:hypothetical protein
MSEINISRACSQKGDGRVYFKTLKVKSTRKRPLGRPRRRREDNIRINAKEIGFNTRSCIESIMITDLF